MKRSMKKGLAVMLSAAMLASSGGGIRINLSGEAEV